MPQWTVVNSSVNSKYVHYGSSSQFIPSQILEALFPDSICLSINSGSKHVVLDITYVKKFNTFKR